MRSNETTMPPADGMQAPDRPVPLPRAVTGMPSASASARTAATSAVERGRGPRRRAAGAWR